MSTHLSINDVLDPADLLPVKQVMVFRTNIRSQKDVRKVKGMLNDRFGRAGWSLDLADIDKVLRIETQSLTLERVIQVIEQAGYCCAELPD